LVEGLNPTDTAEAKARIDILELLRTNKRPFDRENFAPGHVTSSGIVLSPDGSKALLIHHRRLARWLQPGGHVEAADIDVKDAARREITEETGVSLQNQTPELIGVDVHRIPAARNEPDHLHHDLCFSFRAEREAVEPNEETLDARWWSLDEIGRECEDLAVRRYATSAFKNAGSTLPSG
jgi:8-oxo-dGTP pyrophosphatase MutT (NUDIX family)